MKKHLPRIALASLFTIFVSSCGSSNTQKWGPAQPATGAEAPLLNEINKVRTSAGKEPLKRSSNLDSLAAKESTRLASSGERKGNIVAVRSHTGYDRAALLVGSLKDRGPGTGASYPSYWMKSSTGQKYLLGDWHRIGVGSAKSKAGELVSVVVFGGIGGGSLMSPMLR
ncbi:CAP domain-containing protein [Verrucomicrobiaceae bacterium 227]